MSNDDKQPALVPRLRFPEFRDAQAWREKKLFSVFGNITNGKANAQDHVEDGEYPLFDRSEVIKRSDSFMFDAEAVIIPGEGMRFQPRYFKGKFNLHQRAYALLKCKENSAFTFYALDRNKERLAHKAVQSTVLSLRLPILEKFTIGCPNPAEQQKIADCLGSLDDVIAAQRRKLAALRDHKTGLMQQLFPREGETRPRLRFPEFRDAGEWRETTIAGLGEVITGSTPATSRREYYAGDHPFVSPADISNLRFVSDTKTTLTDAGFAEVRKVKAGSVLFVCIGSTIGKVAQCTQTCATNQQINAVVAGSSFVDDFIYYLLRVESGRIAGLSGKQAVPIINKTLFSSVKLFAPERDEQHRIANCLSALDAQIAAQSEKLEALSTHKRGLMQQLFPAPEGAA